MKTTSRRWMLPLLAGMLMLSALCSSGCAGKTLVIPEDRTVRLLPNGNYEVTPAWLQDRYRYERTLLEQLTECKEGKR